ncbi:hypothetical protein CBR_g22029 [Chara braunii]|uniref:MaoC-like domain-containing protein n=1 Tax=Chara braunii TaxID=69332 RepID=A0A388L1W2_CHABU|nr:hypothetical protein CBR_g22029 [Chara braunii]|eukprot:GBG76281.1 hypothetical protein CBR_g22029 [Chara braunii]
MDWALGVVEEVEEEEQQQPEQGEEMEQQEEGDDVVQREEGEDMGEDMEQQEECEDVVQPHEEEEMEQQEEGEGMVQQELQHDVVEKAHVDKPQSTATAVYTRRLRPADSPESADKIPKFPEINKTVQHDNLWVSRVGRKRKEPSQDAPAKPKRAPGKTRRAASLPATLEGAGVGLAEEDRALNSGPTTGVTASSSSSELGPSHSMAMPRKREKTRSETNRPAPSPTTTPSANFDRQRPALLMWEETTLLAQALLFRLCGDVNPIHSNMEIAAKAGFNRPILHGLCTFGYAARAIIRCCCPGHPERLRKLHGRFLLHVFPGETLRTEIWRGNRTRHSGGNLGGEEGGADHNRDVEQVTFRCSVKEQNYGAVLMGTAELISLQARL